MYITPYWAPTKVRNVRLQPITATTYASNSSYFFHSSLLFLLLQKKIILPSSIAQRLRTGCETRHSTVRGIKTRPHCKLLILNSGYVPPYYKVTSRKYFSLILITVLISNTRTQLVSRKSSFIISVHVASWRGPTREPIANPIKLKTY